MRHWHMAITLTTHDSDTGSKGDTDTTTCHNAHLTCGQHFKIFKNLEVHKVTCDDWKFIFH